MADLVGNRGSVDRYRQQRGTPVGYQSGWLSGFSPVRQSDPDFQYLSMVSILRDLTHEPNSARKSDEQSKA